MIELAGRVDLAFHLLSAVVLFATAVVLVYRWPAVGTGIVLVGTVLTAALREPWISAEVDVAGVALAVFDVIALVVTAAAVAAAVTNGVVLDRFHVFAWMLAVLLAFNAIRGVADFGLQAAVNEARPWLYLMAGLLYALNRPVSRVGWWAAALACTGLWLSALAVQGFSETGVNSVTTHVRLDGELVDPRPVTATGAQILVLAILLVAAYRGGLRLVRYAVIVLIAVTVVLLQHRTVWTACAVALCYLGIFFLRAGGRRRLAVLLGAGAAMVVAVVAVSGGVLRGSVLADSVANATQSDNSFAWRLTGWKELVAGHLDAPRLLLGDPFGTGYARIIGGQVVTVSPHSHYVETFLRFGVVGLAVIASIAVLAWRNADAAAGTFGVHPAVVRALLVVILIYGITYRWDAVQVLLLGTILQAARPLPARKPLRPVANVPVAAGHP